MTVKLDKPIFYYGPGDITDPVFASSSLAMDLPATPTLRSIASVGGDIDGDSGIRVAYVVRNDELISLTLRFFETQWPDVVDLLDTVMEGQLFMFFPVATDPLDFELVRLESPRPGAKYEAQPDPQYPRALTLPLVLRISDILDAPTFTPPYNLYQPIFSYPTVTIVGGKLHVAGQSNGGSPARGVWWPIPDEDQVWETKCDILLDEGLWNEQVHLMIGYEGVTQEGLCYGPGHSYSGPGGTFDRRMHIWGFAGTGTMLYRGGTDLLDFSMWLRIERIGDTLNFYHSENHTAWILDTTMSIAAQFSATPNRIGLGAVNHVVNDGTPTTGIFDYIARIS